MMKETEFWRIVGEIGWPVVHYDEAKYRFMRSYPSDVAEDFEELFSQKKAELRKTGEVRGISDSWDDTLAHIIGLGRAEWERNIVDSRLMFQREESLDYRESFAYCIPSPADYDLLTDAGYEPFLRSIRELVGRMDNADPEDIPPREYRQYPGVRGLCELFLEKQWQAGVDRYHERYGPGYADSFPVSFASYAIPNLVQELERFRLRVVSETTHR